MKTPEAVAVAPMLSRTKNIAFKTEVRRFAPEKSGVHPMSRLFPGGYTGADTEQMICNGTSHANRRCATHRNQRQTGSAVRPNGEDDELWLPHDH